MKQKPVTSIIYNFCLSLATATVGTLLLSWPLLALFVWLQKSNALVHQSIEIVMNNYSQLLLYLVNPFRTKLTMSNFPTSASAAEHFYECKLLFQLAIIVFIVGIIIYFFLRIRKKTNYLFLSKTTALIFMILPFTIIPFAMTNFDSFFITFHHLIFNNNNWLFDPGTDPIINVLTEGFFAACFGVAGIIYELYFSRFLLKH